MYYGYLTLIQSSVVDTTSKLLYTNRSVGKWELFPLIDTNSTHFYPVVQSSYNLGLLALPRFHPISFNMVSPLLLLDGCSLLSSINHPQSSLAKLPGDNQLKDYPSTMLPKNLANKNWLFSRHLEENNEKTFTRKPIA